MNLSLLKIKSIFPHFNHRPITPQDFWRVVANHKIVVAQMPMIVDGYYTQRDGRHYILINSKLRGVKWMHTALHELYHYLFDIPNSKNHFTFYRDGKHIDRRECKADAFALMGIMPWTDLMELTPNDLEASPWLSDIVRARIVVRTEFGE